MLLHEPFTLSQRIKYRMLSNARFVQVIAFMRSEGKDKQANDPKSHPMIAAAIIVPLVIVDTETAELYAILHFNHKPVVLLTQKLSSNKLGFMTCFQMFISVNRN